MLDGGALKRQKTLDGLRGEIICGDALEVMKKLPGGSLDLVMTSPPYNLGDEMPYPEYVKWQRACLRQMLRLIRDDGAIFYSQLWRVQNGLMQDRREILRGMPVRQVIIWKRAGGVNFNPGYFLPTYEVIYLIAKPGFTLAPGANGVGDVWSVTQERRNPHPAPQPVELTDRIVASTSGKLLLDPFAGSGTAAVSALRHGRDYILIDSSKEYCEMAARRLSGNDWGGYDEFTHQESFTTFDGEAW
ncbi:MAG TPA: site-specific DNA-methyltransferase [Candidatus Acidoferrum sp.]|nr:site-specific DNA-methyltransferase [Candidatus Acidoferrum sp.]